MANFKACIANYCKSCIYDKSEPGTWREQVEACGASSCELYSVRPKSVATVSANRKPRKKIDIVEVVV